MRNKLIVKLETDRRYDRILGRTFKGELYIITRIDSERLKYSYHALKEAIDNGLVKFGIIEGRQQHFPYYLKSWCSCLDAWNAFIV